MLDETRADWERSSHIVWLFKTGVLLLCLQLLSAAFNVFVICRNFADRPVRDSSVPYNLTALFLYWLEFLMLVFTLVGLGCGGIQHRLGVGDVSYAVSGPVYVRMWIKTASINTLSSLSMIAQLPQQLSLHYELLSKHKALKSNAPLRVLVMLYVVALLLFVAGVGLLTLVFKISQVSFIGYSSPLDWSAGQWIAFLGLANNLAHIAALDDWAFRARYLRVTVQRDNVKLEGDHLEELAVQRMGWLLAVPWTIVKLDDAKTHKLLWHVDTKEQALTLTCGAA